jgi:hypothetical protein
LLEESPTEYSAFYSQNIIAWHVSVTNELECSKSVPLQLFLSLGSLENIPKSLLGFIEIGYLVVYVLKVRKTFCFRVIVEIPGLASGVN